jgi:SHS family sialic acid transporter-like MFS transporter
MDRLLGRQTRRGENSPNRVRRPVHCSDCRHPRRRGRLHRQRPDAPLGQTLSLVTCAYLFRAGFTYGPAFLTLVFLTGAFTASFYAWLPLYLPELFPTRVRATAQGFAYNIGRVLAAAGILCSGQLLNHFNEDYAKMCSVISLVYVAGLIVIWFCPETRGKPLPD